MLLAKSGTAVKLWPVTVIVRIIPYRLIKRSIKTNSSSSNVYIKLMKKIRNAIKNLVETNGDWLLATFIASMLGVIGSEMVMRIGVALAGNPGWLAYLLISFVATLVYAVGAAGTFYLIVPESRPAFKKLWEKIR